MKAKLHNGEAIRWQEIRQKPYWDLGWIYTFYVGNWHKLPRLSSPLYKVF